MPVLLSMQGEEQKKLDILSNDVFVNALRSSGRTVRRLTHSPPFPHPQKHLKK